MKELKWIFSPLVLSYLNLRRDEIHFIKLLKRTLTINGFLRKITNSSGRQSPINGNKNSHKTLEISFKVCYHLTQKKDLQLYKLSKQIFIWVKLLHRKKLFKKCLKDLKKLTLNAKKIDKAL